MMQWTCKHARDFNTIASEWDELNRSQYDLAFFDSRFVTPLISHFLSGDEILLLGYQQGQLACAGIFQPTGKGRWATAMPSQCPLGLLIYAQPQLSDALVSEIAKQLPGVVLTIDFLQMDSRYIECDSSPRFDTMPYITTGRRPVEADFDAFFKGLGKNMRQNYNKVINRAERAGDQLTTAFVSSPEDVEQAVIKYGEIESAGWKGAEGTAISPDNTQGKFYREALTSLAASGQAVCWYYLINDEIVAVDLCILQSGMLIILKTTYNEAYNKQSPALQLKVEMLRHYADHRDQVDVVEFYGKAMEWHKRLNSELRPIQHISWFRSSLIKQAIGLVKKIKQ